MMSLSFQILKSFLTGCFLYQKTLILTIQNLQEMISVKEDAITVNTDPGRMEEEEVEITENQTTDPLKEEDKKEQSCDPRSWLFLFKIHSINLKWSIED